MVVGFIGEELWTHVVRGSDQRAGHVILILQHSCNAKVSNFDDVGLREEDILCFQVPMQNVSLVQVLESESEVVTSDGLGTFKRK